MVYKVSSEDAGDRMEQILERAEQEAEGVLIVRGTKTFVLIEQSKIRDLQENKAQEQLSSLFDAVAPIAQEYQQKRSIKVEDIFR